MLGQVGWVMYYTCLHLLLHFSIFLGSFFPLSVPHSHLDKEGMQLCNAEYNYTKEKPVGLIWGTMGGLWKKLDQITPHK